MPTHADEPDVHGALLVAVLAIVCEQMWISESCHRVVGSAVGHILERCRECANVSMCVAQLSACMFILGDVRTRAHAAGRRA